MPRWPVQRSLQKVVEKKCTSYGCSDTSHILFPNISNIRCNCPPPFMLTLTMLLLSVKRLASISGAQHQRRRETPWNQRRLMCAEPLLSPGLAGVPTDRSGGTHVEINDCAVTGRGHWRNLSVHVSVWPGHQGSALWSSVTVVAPSKGDRNYFYVNEDFCTN